MENRQRFAFFSPRAGRPILLRPDLLRIVYPANEATAAEIFSGNEEISLRPYFR